MAFTPPTYTPSGNLFGGTTPTTSYTYGNLAPTTSSYNVWGSHGSPLGNPYLIAGPTYTPGSGAPLVPQPIAPPVAPPTQGGGDSGPIPDWVDPNSAESQAQSYGDLQSWLDRPPHLTEGVSTLLGAPLFTPAVDLMYGINPYTQQSYSWYDGSTNDFGYVGSDATLSGQDLSAAVAAYDLDFEAGMTDLGQDEYIAQYMSERENDDPNNPAQDVPGWLEGIWGSSQDPIAIQAQQAIATANANAAAAIQAEAEAAQAEAQAEAAAQQQQLDLMNNIALDMQSQYGDFTSQTGEQLANMAAENASMFDSLEEYQQWMSDNNATAPATPSNPPPATVAEAVAEGKPFGKEGDDTWSPDGKNVYHGPGHNWNTPDSENTAPPGTVTPPPSSNDGGSSDEAGSASNSNMADAGFSQEDQDFIDSGFDEEDSGGDSGGGGGGKVICTAMNADYGFGSYRNAIWLRYAALNFSDKPEMELGYHALVLPMLKIRKKWYGKPLYAWLKHVAVHRTADLKAEMYGKERDRIGQVWRFFLEPLCYVTGILINKLKGDK